jgi:anion-transporting  ArsA/GET3 family ATPase
MPLVENRRVILCVGCGGVGKTTVSAAIALAAARRGKSVLCLTIDPAPRLANALGFERLVTEAQTVGAEWFRGAGLEVRGQLTVMMLDTKRTFDQLVEHYAPSGATRDRILANRLYQHLSTRLAGTREYMAMEKLLWVKQDPSYDLIVLDTPPTSNALDFLDAPERLTDTLDSPTLGWLKDTVSQTGGFRMRMLAKGARYTMRGIARLTGSGMFEHVGGLIRDLNDLFGGFKSRARAVAEAFRADDVGYVLVTSPAPDAMREVLFFAERLAQMGMRRDAFVVNRVHTLRRGNPTLAEIKTALGAHGLAPGHDSAEGVARAWREELEQAETEASYLEEFALALERHTGRPSERVVMIPAFPGDVHELPTLARIAAMLCQPSTAEA